MVVEGQWELGTGAREAGCFPTGGSQPQHMPLQVPMSNGPSGSSPGKSEVKLELAFEYLMSKDRLQWVTITSPQVGLAVDKDGSEGAAVRDRAGLGSGWCVGVAAGCMTPLPCRPSC